MSVVNGRKSRPVIRTGLVDSPKRSGWQESGIDKGIVFAVVKGETRMKCSYCKGRGIVVTGYGDIFKCNICRGTGNVEPLTNEEWFCSLPTEEKAKVLYNFFMARTFCHICPENNVCDIGYKCKYGNGEVEDFIKWLKQPHNGE